jgi:trk system potassium uptake protein TrkA
MYVVIIGGGKIGYHLSKALLGVGHEVFIIERDARKVQRIRDELGNLVLKGDGSEPNVLSEAGLSRANLLVAATGSDEDNLAACQLAKESFGVGGVISVITDPENEVLFRLLGINLTVSSTQVILGQIEEDIPSRSEVHVMSVRGSREMLWVEVPLGASVIGIQIQALNLSPDTIINAIIGRDGTLKTVQPDTVIAAYDQVLALAKSDEAEVLLDALTREE